MLLSLLLALYCRVLKLGGIILLLKINNITIQSSGDIFTDGLSELWGHLEAGVPA